MEKVSDAQLSKETPLLKLKASYLFIFCSFTHTEKAYHSNN
jgi:hypothetical protein